MPSHFHHRYHDRTSGFGLTTVTGILTDRCALCRLVHVIATYLKERNVHNSISTDEYTCIFFFHSVLRTCKWHLQKWIALFFFLTNLSTAFCKRKSNQDQQLDHIMCRNVRNHYHHYYQDQDHHHQHHGIIIIIYKTSTGHSCFYHYHYKKKKKKSILVKINSRSCAAMQKINNHASRSRSSSL